MNRHLKPKNHPSIPPCVSDKRQWYWTEVIESDESSAGSAKPKSTHILFALGTPETSSASTPETALSSSEDEPNLDCSSPASSSAITLPSPQQEPVSAFQFVDFTKQDHSATIAYYAPNMSLTDSKYISRFHFCIPRWVIDGAFAAYDLPNHPLFWSFACAQLGNLPKEVRQAVYRGAAYTDANIQQILVDALVRAADEVKEFDAVMQVEPEPQITQSNDPFDFLTEPTLSTDWYQPALDTTAFSLDSFLETPSFDFFQTEGQTVQDPFNFGLLPNLTFVPQVPADWVYLTGDAGALLL